MIYLSFRSASRVGYALLFAALTCGPLRCHADTWARARVHECVEGKMPYRTTAPTAAAHSASLFLGLLTRGDTGSRRLAVRWRSPRKPVRFGLCRA
jgi:hypothetical protein